MVESVAVSPTSDVDEQRAALARPAYPPLYRTLAIARRGCEDPSTLTEGEIEDLARTMLMHYAHMGIA